jgi:toxin ParE1/3/4
VQRLTYSRAAERDLAEIHAYTIARWGEAQADRYLSDLESACNRIADGSAIVSRLPFRADEMFRARQGRHFIIFREEVDGGVLIVRVLHERMDVDRHV